jgi:tetratricopeptide (TPR) repeat protein
VKFPALKETHPEVLARHWSEAGETERAIAEWERAGKGAEERNAFIEAQESYQQALALLGLLTESPERDERELELRQSLVSMLHLTRGYSSAEAVEAFERVAALAEKGGNLLQMVGSASTRGYHSYSAGDLSTAATLADDALGLAQRDSNPTVMAYLRRLQQSIHFFRGDLAGVEKHFAAGLRFFDDPVFRQSRTGDALSVFAVASWNAWLLGRADVARERLAKMWAAVNPANPHDLAWSNHLAAVLHALMGEYETLEALAMRAVELCEEHRFPQDAAAARCFLGHARAQLGRAPEGIALMHGGIDTLLRIGARIMLPFLITYLAVAHLGGGAIADALETVEQALNFNPQETVCRPETLRIRGEIRSKQAGLQLAEADFRDSIALAKSMGAKSWELRTVMSLARLLASQGRAHEARVMLAEIYNWFTEGFDTPDLKDAKALLGELSV